MSVDKLSCGTALAYSTEGSSNWT